MPSNSGVGKKGDVRKNKEKFDVSNVLGYTLYPLYMNNRENLTIDTTPLTTLKLATAGVDTPSLPNMSLKVETIIIIILSILTRVYAVWLSWNCSGQFHILLRVIFALFAFIFGFIYLVLYFFMKSYSCCSKKKTQIK